MVKSAELSIIWDKEAIKQLKKAYNRILKESYQGAIIVRDGILDAIEEIPNQPYKYPADKFKQNNSGIYRVFELYSYRIAYKITDKHIQILRVRHTKRESNIY